MPYLYSFYLSKHNTTCGSNKILLLKFFLKIIYLFICPDLTNRIRWCLGWVPEGSPNIYIVKTTLIFVKNIEGRHSALLFIVIAKDVFVFLISREFSPFVFNNSVCPAFHSFLQFVISSIVKIKAPMVLTEQGRTKNKLHCLQF